MEGSHFGVGPWFTVLESGSEQGFGPFFISDGSESGFAELFLTLTLTTSDEEISTDSHTTPDRSNSTPSLAALGKAPR